MLDRTWKRVGMKSGECEKRNTTYFLSRSEWSSSCGKRRQTSEITLLCNLTLSYTSCVLSCSLVYFIKTLKSLKLEKDIGMACQKV